MGENASESEPNLMVVEHLQRALEHIDELTPDEQEDVAEQILAYAGRIEPRGARAQRLAGAWADLPDMTGKGFSPPQATPFQRQW